MVFFFFKQKTAYEVRISDWSSDVCSSDLYLAAPVAMCTMRPHPRAIMPPKTALVNSIGDSRPVSIPERQSSEVMPLQSGVYGGGEQVATRMSGSGQASRISSRPAGVE